MECRKLVITLVSADNLPDVRNLFRMKVYAKVSVGGKSKTTRKTPVDREGETNPRWNFPIEYTISESTVRKEGVNLNIKLFCKRTLGDRYIGEVNVSVKGLFDEGLKSEGIMSYDVGGTRSGRLNILYSFGDKILVNKPSGFIHQKKKPSGRGKAVEDVFSVLDGKTLILLNGEDDGYDDVGEGSNDSDDYEDGSSDAFW